MKPDEAVTAMAARLGAADWERYGDKAWSKAALLREYFRRAARVSAAYGCESPVPFFDLAACLNAGVRADQGVIDELLARIKKGGRNGTHVAPFILHWAALLATPGTDFPAELEDPFEPLILMVERGGGFHTENGEVNLEWLAVPMAGWRKHADRAPMASFAPEVLDEIDRAGSIAQFGYVIGRDE
jgi:hypothetical protein